MPTAEFFARLGLFTVPGFIDPAECERLRSEMGSMRTAQAATVRDRERTDTYGVDEDTRRTKVAEVSPEALSLVEQRLLAVKPKVEEHFGVPLTRLQRLQFLVYSEGDFFRRHVDRGEDSDVAFSRERRISAVIFLNGESADEAPDTYGGGALTFYGLLDQRGKGIGLPLTGEEGLLVAFGADVIHEVTPVTHGQRYTVVTWFA